MRFRWVGFTKIQGQDRTRRHKTGRSLDLEIVMTHLMKRYARPVSQDGLAHIAALCGVRLLTVSLKLTVVDMSIILKESNPNSKEQRGICDTAVRIHRGIQRKPGLHPLCISLLIHYQPTVSLDRSR